MSFSLYVEKPDGNREDLDDVSVDTAREVFAKFDWAAAINGLQEAEASGTSFFFPEFGLADDGGLGGEAQRTLTISPVTVQAISFQFGSQGRMWQAEELPFDEAPNLIGLFFSGEDDAIVALTQPRPIEVREFSSGEFHATVLPPPVELDDHGVYNKVRLRDYISACLDKYHLPATLETIEFEHVVGFADFNDYSFEKQFAHLIFDYGDPGQWLSIVVKLGKNGLPNHIMGHHFLGTDADCYTPRPLSEEERRTLLKFEETRQIRFWSATPDEGVKLNAPSGPLP